MTTEENVDDPFDLGGTPPARTLTEHKNKPTKGDNRASTHERFRKEMESGQKSVDAAKDFLHRRVNSHKHVYEVWYWLSAADKLDFDEAIAEDREPKKQPLRTQFTHPDIITDSMMIGEAWWKGVAHKGVGHFANENVRNTKPFYVEGKYVAENPYYVEPKQMSADEKDAAAKLKKDREKNLANFKKHGTLESAGAKRSVSNQIVPSS